MLAQKQLNDLKGVAPPGQCRLPLFGRRQAAMSPLRLSDAFTLIELLVVISIIAILIALLLPALGQFRMQGYVTSTTEEMATVKTACLMYYSNYNAYPGPFSEADVASGAVGGVTGTQNMLIGLMGTMYNTSPSSWPTGTTPVTISGSTSGGGTAYVTNPLGSGPIDYTKGNVRQKSYLSPDPTLLLTIYGTGGNPSLPTLYDTFSDGLPILYYRKIPGLPGTTGVPVQLQAGYTPPGAFYLNSNEAYITNTNISDSLLPATSGATYDETSGSLGPWNLNRGATGALACEVVEPSSLPAPSTTTQITNTSAPNTLGTPVRGGFVLISAGPDRIYGPPLATSTQLTSASAALNDDIIVAGGK